MSVKNEISSSHFERKMYDVHIYVFNETSLTVEIYRQTIKNIMLNLSAKGE